MRGKRAFFLAVFPDSCHNSHALASIPHTIFYSVGCDSHRRGGALTGGGGAPRDI